MLENARLDLHCHSYYSDGTTSIADLLKRAGENGVTHLAITDHDCVDGLEDVAGYETDVVVIPGVEISSAWQGIEVHIVGLFVDRHEAHLQSLLLAQQAARRTRVEKMSTMLETQGTSGLNDYLEALPAVSLTRSHVANFLVEQGVCKTRQKSFKSHLSRRGKIYVESQWCALEIAINAIAQAGGIAVLAHPGRYPISKSKLALLAREFKASGGVALEGSYPNIEPNMMRRLEVLAIDCGLLLSCGSDFHDPEARWTDIGKFPRLGQSAQSHGVWQHPVWRTHFPEAYPLSV
jgi:predicted metal-dependent phosphoesterase TrpH